MLQVRGLPQAGVGSAGGESSSSAVMRKEAILGFDNQPQAGFQEGNMTQPQLSSMQDQDLKNSADPEGKNTSAEYRRPWITPRFKPLDLRIARASGCGTGDSGSAG